MASSKNQTKGQINNQLMNEKSLLKKEEQKLRKLITAIKEQINTVEVERLAVVQQEKEEVQNLKGPIETQDPIFKVPFNPPPIQEVNKTKLNLDVLDQISRGTFEAEEEEDSD